MRKLSTRVYNAVGVLISRDLKVIELSLQTDVISKKSYKRYMQSMQYNYKEKLRSLSGP